jgi:hypothetical protein
VLRYEQKKIIVLTSIIIFTFICVGVYFMLNYNPCSLRYVMRKLDSYLEIEYKYVSTYRASEPNIEGIKPVTYLFEDINGLGFEVVTFPPFGDYDSSQPGYPRCDYLTAYYESKKETVEKAFQHGIPITIIAECQASGLSVKTWCDQNGFKERPIINTLRKFVNRKSKSFLLHCLNQWRNRFYSILTQYILKGFAICLILLIGYVLWNIFFTRP